MTPRVRTIRSVVRLDPSTRSQRLSLPRQDGRTTTIAPRTVADVAPLFDGTARHSLRLTSGSLPPPPPRRSCRGCLAEQTDAAQRPLDASDRLRTRTRESSSPVTSPSRSACSGTNCRRSSQNPTSRLGSPRWIRTADQFARGRRQPIDRKLQVAPERSRGVRGRSCRSPEGRVQRTGTEPDRHWRTGTRTGMS